MKTFGTIMKAKFLASAQKICIVQNSCLERFKRTLNKVQLSSALSFGSRIGKPVRASFSFCQFYYGHGSAKIESALIWANTKLTRIKWLILTSLIVLGFLSLFSLIITPELLLNQYSPIQLEEALRRSGFYKREKVSATDSIVDLSDASEVNIPRYPHDDFTTNHPLMPKIFSTTNHPLIPKIFSSTNHPLIPKIISSTNHPMFPPKRITPFPPLPQLQNVSSTSSSKYTSRNYLNVFPKSNFTEARLGLLKIVSKIDSHLLPENGSKSHLPLPKLRDKAVKYHCKFPKVDLHNKEVKPYTKNARKIVCPLEEYKVFQVDHRSNLIQLLNTSKFNLTKCCFTALNRTSDFKTTASPNCHEIVKNVTKINGGIDYIGIQCFNTTAKKIQYVEMFPVPSDKKPSLSASNKRPMVNVIILGLDATSHLNFQRIMPKTFKYITRNMSAIGLRWLNKNGDNTMPNMLVALTGYTLEEIRKRCWKNEQKSYFDSCPFIWQKFSGEGYLTAFAEDLAGIATYQYGKRGFQKPPTDYYLRPLTIFQEKHLRSNWEDYVPQCFGPRTPTKVVLNFMETLTSALNEKRRNYFQYLWTESMTHGSMTRGAQLDEVIASTISSMHTKKDLNNTVFIMMSDHGFRFGGYRNTYNGDLESKMPFVYFAFPPWFKKQFPTAVKNFKLNANSRLTTFYDFHATLKDLLYLDRSVSEKRVKERMLALNNLPKLPQSISLFLPTPKYRNCSDAGISKKYCICNALPQIKNLTHSFLQSSAMFLLKKINEDVIKQTKNSTKCARLELEKIHNAKGHLMNVKDDEHWHTITIMTVPGNATFEATITNVPEKTSRNFTSEFRWGIVGDVTRTNSYKNQSHCVKDVVLKSFCYCQNTKLTNG